MPYTSSILTSQLQGNNNETTSWKIIGFQNVYNQGKEEKSQVHQGN